MRSDLDKQLFSYSKLRQLKYIFFRKSVMFRKIGIIGSDFSKSLVNTETEKGGNVNKNKEE